MLLEEERSCICTVGLQHQRNLCFILVTFLLYKVERSSHAIALQLKQTKNPPFYAPFTLYLNRPHETGVFSVSGNKYKVFHHSERAILIVLDAPVVAFIALLWGFFSDQNNFSHEQNLHHWPLNALRKTNQLYFCVSCKI